MAKVNFDGVVGSRVLHVAASAALALCFLVSCDDSSSSSGGEDALDALPTCSDAFEGSTSSIEDVVYVCSNGSWHKSDVADSLVKGDSSVVDSARRADSLVADTSKKDDSSVKDSLGADTTKTADTSAVDTNVADTAKTDPAQEQAPLGKKNVSLTGFVEYGLFDARSSVVVEEIDSSLQKTGVSFTGSVSSKDGSFAVNNASMMGPYALVTVKGSASNMALGSSVHSNDTLSVLVAVDDSVSVNINALSFLVSERAMALLKNAESPKTFAQASKEAAEQAWTLFGLDGLKSENPSEVKMSNGKESGSALLAVTVLLQAMVNDSNANISNVAKAFADGTLADSLVLAKMADWAFDEDMSDEFAEVESNVQKQGFATVPEFAKVVKAFYFKELGLASCDESKQGSITFVTNKFSVYFAADYSDASVSKERFKCEDGLWNIALDKEKDTFGFEGAADGEARQGLVNKDLIYTFNGATWRQVTTLAEKDAFFVQKSNITEFVDIQGVYESIKDDERVIFVLRHGARDQDKTSKGDPLSEKGYKECVSVGKKLTKFKEPFRLGASEFYRAQQTSIGIAEGRGQDTTVADTLAFLNDDWYMIDRNLVNQAEDNAHGGWEATSLYVYNGEFPEAYYNLADRSAQLIDTLLTTYADVPDRFIMLSSHDKLMVPFVAYCSNLKLNMNIKNGGTWINYLAGVAIIWDKSGNRRYVAVKGLESAYFQGW